MKRRGGVLMEAITALMLLSVLVMVTSQMAALMNRQSRLLSQRSVAFQECHQALAKIAAMKPSSLSEEALASIKLPAEALVLLPDGTLTIQPLKTGNSEEGVQLKATVRWRPAANAEMAEASLSLWRFDLELALLPGAAP